MATALWVAAIYLAIGFGVTVVLSQTPYAENSWLATTLLWPLFAYSFLAL